MNPDFHAARVAEQRRRLLTHAGLAEPLTLPLRSRPGCTARVALVPLTERHRLELSLAGNAFFCARAPLLGDVLQFLWRLNPAFRRPAGTCPNLPPTDAGRSPLRTRLRAWLARAALARAVRRVDLFAAELAIRAWLETTAQDTLGDAGPGDGFALARSAAAPAHCFADELVEYFARTYGLAPAAILDLPVMLVHQLLRARALGQEDGDLAVFAPSDALFYAKPAAA